MSAYPHSVESRIKAIARSLCERWPQRDTHEWRRDCRVWQELRFTVPARAEIAARGNSSAARELDPEEGKERLVLIVQRRRIDAERRARGCLTTMDRVLFAEAGATPPHDPDAYSGEEAGGVALGQSAA